MKHLNPSVLAKVIPTDFESWLPFLEKPLSSPYWSNLPKEPKATCTAQFERIFERYQDKSRGMNALISKEIVPGIERTGVLVQYIDGKQALDIGYCILPSYVRQGDAFQAAQHCKRVAFKKQWAQRQISTIHGNHIPF